MVLSCDLLPLGVPGTCTVPATPSSSCCSTSWACFCGPALGKAVPGRGPPQDPLPITPLPWHSPHPSPLIVPSPPQSPHPLSVLSGLSGAILHVDSVSGQLLKVTFVSVVLCALSWLLGGPCRSPLSPSSPRFPRTPTPCLGGSSGAGCPLLLGCEQWSEQPFILPAGVKCILC